MPRPSRIAVQLFLCGLCALFWELALIRWHGSCVRIVAYYSNFILLSAFFGLGAGALLARRTSRDLEPFLAPALAAAVLLGIALSGLVHGNPAGGLEYVWIGAPEGVDPLNLLLGGRPTVVPYWALLAAVYVANAGVFLLFGHYLGRLFALLPPLRGYGIAGSLAGILLFGALSAAGIPPPAWFVVGFVALFACLPWKRSTALVGGATALLAVLASIPFSGQYLWSPYYKIEFEPLQRLVNPALGREMRFSAPIGYTLVVNNDYHQMLLDLRERKDEPEFLSAWRWIYDRPYATDARLPDGPILVVGAGTGNDVSAAVRNTGRRIDAVEIDPAILRLGKRFHPENPYGNERVTVHLDDARSFFQKTRERYALVVFGFLDSHTLLSSFTSLRLDNFVYTREAMEAVRGLLLPGGEVYLTFASNTPWLHERITGLLDAAFDGPTRTEVSPGGRFANGVVYGNSASTGPRAAGPPASRAAGAVEEPTDDWPFLYLKSRAIPPHYRVFLVIVVTLGVGTLFLLPRGQRRVRVPYFLLGAAFFLLETSNVVSLSLLYGSTWTVNVVVFSGILALVLLGNLASALPRWETPPLWVFGLLLGSVALGYLVRPAALLAVPEGLPRAAAAVVVFLSPVLFASLVFGTLIRRERRFPEAYGSNVLGAVLGGALEYTSMLFGFKALLVVTFALYALAALLLTRERPGPPTT